ncbi:solute carrier family 41 member 1 [Pisolithus croceorrhizus]|nr:solute carrier family 41 member 1 [Pisolithus croceorrhizus]
MNGREEAHTSHSGSDLTSINSDDIELEALERLEGASHAGNLRTAEYDTHEDGGQDEDGRAALLAYESGIRDTGLIRERSHYPAWWRQAGSIVVESAPTLLLTTVGLLFTGELLDHVSRWRAMRAINELIMIVPVILNLKGNLEMNLSARLGTAANMGSLDDPRNRRNIIYGNLALLQIQAAVVASVAACVSMALGSIVPDPPSTAPISFGGEATNSTTLISRAPRPLPMNPGQPKSGVAEFIMVASSAMMSACLSSVLLGSFMCALIVACRRFGRDPDNIAPPVASCLGDLVTLCLLAAVSSLLINFINTPLPSILILCLVLSATSCFFIVRRNNCVKDLVWRGWLPLFGAMVISSATGIVLDIFASRYQGFPLLAVVISGLPGSVGSIAISRLSTSLHAEKHHAHSRRKEPSKKLVTTTLLLITIPVEIIFLATLQAFGWLKLSILFAVLSVLLFCCAVTISLLIANALTDFLWSKDLDPDMYALPIHSATMDLVGQLLLVLCFQLVSLTDINL